VGVAEPEGRGIAVLVPVVGIADLGVAGVAVAIVVVAVVTPAVRRDRSVAVGVGGRVRAAIALLVAGVGGAGVAVVAVGRRPRGAGRFGAALGAVAEDTVVAVEVAPAARGGRRVSLARVGCAGRRRWIAARSQREQEERQRAAWNASSGACHRPGR